MKPALTSPFTSIEQQQRFVNDVISLLAAYGEAHQRTGNRDGELSLSDLIDKLRHGTTATDLRKWSNLRTTGFGTTVQDLLPALGFTLRSVRVGTRGVVRTYVSV